MSRVKKKDGGAKTKNKVTVQHAAEMSALYQKGFVRGKKLLELFPWYSKATVYRHATRPIGAALIGDYRKENPGRPRKVDELAERRILRSFAKLRESDGSFTAPRVRLESGMEKICSVRTVQRVLHKAGYA